MGEPVSGCCGAPVDDGACEECEEPCEPVETVDGMVSDCCGESVVDGTAAAAFFYRKLHQCVECLEMCDAIEPDEYDPRPDRPMSKLEKIGVVDLLGWHHLTPGYKETEEGHIITGHSGDDVAILVETWSWTAQLNADEKFTWEAWPFCEVLVSLEGYGFNIVWTDSRGNEVDDPRFKPMPVDDFKRLFDLTDDEFEEVCTEGYVEFNETEGEARAVRPENKWHDDGDGDD